MKLLWFTYSKIRSFNTDGASSVHGSDAIAGVTNAILRSDFEGWEVEAYAAESPYQDGFTDDITFNLTWGKVFDSS